jgi:hypothetical protein
MHPRIKLNKILSSSRTATDWQVTSIGWKLDSDGTLQDGRKRHYTEFCLMEAQTMYQDTTNWGVDSY